MLAAGRTRRALASASFAALAAALYAVGLSPLFLSASILFTVATYVMCHDPS